MSDSFYDECVSVRMTVRDFCIVKQILSAFSPDEKEIVALIDAAIASGYKTFKAKP